VKNNPFLKVFEVLRNFFQKVSKWGAGAKPRIASPPTNQNLNTTGFFHLLWKKSFLQFF
jgi:hypothetical protein